MSARPTGLVGALCRILSDAKNLGDADTIAKAALDEFHEAEAVGYRQILDLAQRNPVLHALLQTRQHGAMSAEEWSRFAIITLAQAYMQMFTALVDLTNRQPPVMLYAPGDGEPRFVRDANTAEMLKLIEDLDVVPLPSDIRERVLRLREGRTK